MSAIIGTLALVPLYLVFLSIFTITGGQKLLSSGVPDWFVKQFENTFLGRVPQAVPYYAIALLEAGVAVLFVLSAIQLEFLPGHDRPLLLAGLLLAQFTFFCLGFGLRISGDFQGAANLFSYFGITLLLFLTLQLGSSPV